MRKFIFDTTGVASVVKFEELGAYFNHPTSAYTLTDYFEVEEIREATTIQDAIDNNHIIAYDESGNTITSINYLVGDVPVFDMDNFQTDKTYVGYGTSNACKIQLVETQLDGTYDVSWASGNQSFDKLWVNRNFYTYF